jgi:hypothetical protein
LGTRARNCVAQAEAGTVDVCGGVSSRDRPGQTGSKLLVGFLGCAVTGTGFPAGGKVGQAEQKRPRLRLVGGDVHGRRANGCRCSSCGPGLLAAAAGRHRTHGQCARKDGSRNRARRHCNNFRALARCDVIGSAGGCPVPEAGRIWLIPPGSRRHEADMQEPQLAASQYRGRSCGKSGESPPRQSAGARSELGSRSRQQRWARLSARRHEPTLIAAAATRRPRVPRAAPSVRQTYAGQWQSAAFGDELGDWGWLAPRLWRLRSRGYLADNWSRRLPRRPPRLRHAPPDSDQPCR